LVIMGLTELEVVLKKIYPSNDYDHNYNGHDITAENGRKLYEQIASIDRSDNQKLLKFDISWVEIAIAALYLFRID